MSKDKYKNHAFYNLLWNKLTIKDKDYALECLSNLKREREFNKRKYTEIERLRKLAETEGRKCFCFPINSVFFRHHQRCDYCEWDSDNHLHY
jgi:hypothetical protein